MILFFRLTIILIALSFVVIAVNGQKKQTEEMQNNKAEAEKLWEKTIEAKGGREKLHSVNNMIISSRSKVQYSLFKSYDHIVESLYVFPDKEWRWDDNRPSVFGLQMSMYNYATGMKYHQVLGSPDNIAKLVPFGASEQKRIGSHLAGLVDFLLETKWWQPIPESVTKGAKGFKNADTIHTLFNGQKLDFVVDRKTQLPVQTIGYYIDSNTKQTRQNIYNISDYIEVDGIMMPSKFSFGGQNGVENLSYKFNVEYDESIFNIPPSFETGSEAWKVKK